jgi:hypothetical protein
MRAPIPEHRDEEQQAEQQAPEHAPGRTGAHRVMAGVHVILTFGIPHDHRDGVRLDDQVTSQPACLLGGLLGGSLVGVADCDQIRHVCPLLG